MSAEKEEGLNLRRREREICYITDEDKDNDGDDEDEWIPGESKSNRYCFFKLGCTYKMFGALYFCFGLNSFRTIPSEIWWLQITICTLNIRDCHLLNRRVIVIQTKASKLSKTQRYG